MYGNVEKEEAPIALPANMSAAQIISKFIAVTGGEDAWKKVNDLTMKMTTDMQGRSFNFNTTRKAPNKMLLDINAAGQSFQKIVFDGVKGYTTQMGQKKEMDAKEIAENLDEASMVKDLAYLSASYKTELKGIEKVDGNNAYQIVVTKPNGEKITEYYDVATSYKVKSEVTMETPQGSMTETTYYQDYKEAKGGLKFPYTIKQSAGPQMMDMKLQSVEINTGVSDEMFK
jgi:outer membrane lipoprotein-sorting protein